VRLVDLNPRWLSHAEGREGTFIDFDCPCGACGSSISIAVDPPLDGGVPAADAAHQWKREGESFDTLTLRPSLERKDHCRWHGFITNGEVTSV
jgi:hypothetical protein